ncbi:MAG: dihydroorotate dehydrogenase electron transfer subunit [Candidatus Korarchaeota archaeon]|nr:dihydroorotate dehydrogenase electron transfer subunit [Candidatus Korarchaeota archaeon]
MRSLRGHRPHTVAESEPLTPRVRRIVLKGEIGALPGQYVMVWVPKVGEIPVSVAREGNGETWLLVARVGKVSSAIHSLKAGDRLWIRGPYGRGYTTEVEGKVALVGGGYGIAPLIHLADALTSRGGVRIEFYAGFRSAEEVMLEDLMRDLSDRLVVSTDDGSYGLSGFITEHIDYKGLNFVYTAGPEAMMVKVVSEAVRRGIRVEASLERLIRCAVGLCGACVLDPQGLLVCRDGPVFDGAVLMASEDFGKYWRDFDGRKIPLGALSR